MLLTSDLQKSPRPMGGMGGIPYKSDRSDHQKF